MTATGRVQSTKKYDIKSPEPTDQRSVLIQISPSPDFMSVILKNGKENYHRHFSNHAPKKVVKQVKAVFRPEKTRRHPHRLRHLHRLPPSRFDKMSVF
jgi:hypothetical protein